MAEPLIPKTRSQFKDYCLRKLGAPVLDINLDDDQIEDRVNDALQFFGDYHFDGVEKLFLKHQIKAEDVARRWIYVPDVIKGVISILPFDNSSASVNMFDLRYQLRLHDLYDFTSVSYVPYEITMQHIRTLNLLFSGHPQVRFNRHGNKLYVDTDWTRDMLPGKWLIIECYRFMNPDNVTITGNVSITAGSNQIVGTNTLFNQELMVEEEITIGTETVRVSNVLSSTLATASANFANTLSGVNLVKTGLSDVWNDRFLKKYATALLKKQWGENLSKFSGIQMPGGVTLNGQIIKEEAIAEIKNLEEEIINTNVLPSDFIMG